MNPEKSTIAENLLCYIALSIISIMGLLVIAESVRLAFFSPL